MDIQELKKILAGLGMAGLVAGAGLTLGQLQVLLGAAELAQRVVQALPPNKPQLIAAEAE